MPYSLAQDYALVVVENQKADVLMEAAELELSVDGHVVQVFAVVEGNQLISEDIHTVQVFVVVVEDQLVSEDDHVVQVFVVVVEDQLVSEDDHVVQGEVEVEVVLKLQNDSSLVYNVALEVQEYNKFEDWLIDGFHVPAAIFESKWQIQKDPEKKFRQIQIDSDSDRFRQTDSDRFRQIQRD
ncbi:hypothetical protein BDQ12DRAFT_665608 [Crucibulum laeve]|uniref:Uncharacterized protein n=1 Tax=Crucibulum laeve TaxID=68775 RepID=A0A5C3MDQ3_9AGAR|nr:hypothetical protein BDQ12DRAFT_665608 [Crucibulum laeve]